MNFTLWTKRISGVIIALAGAWLIWQA